MWLPAASGLRSIRFTILMIDPPLRSIHEIKRLLSDHKDAKRPDFGPRLALAGEGAQAMLRMSVLTVRAIPLSENGWTPTAQPA